MRKRPQADLINWDYDRSHPPARERIWTAVKRLFPMYGIRAVSMEMIARHAETNTPAVHRHFVSKEHIVVEYLTHFARIEESSWEELERDCPNDPEAHLRVWLGGLQESATDRHSGRNELSRAAAELSHIDHTAQAVIRRHKLAIRSHVAELCRAAGYQEPEALADKLLMLTEGARAGEECIGPDGPGIHLVSAAETLMASHSAKAPER